MKQSKRKITACLVAAVLLLSLVPTVALAEGETGTATVRLVVQKDWGDNSGYILLMDADANVYGNQMESDGALSAYGQDVDPAVMALFESKLPIGADGKRNGDNMLRCGESADMQVPAGTYDWTLLNPTPDTSDYGGSVYVAVDGCGNDLQIKAGYVYTFTVQDLGDSGDRVVLHEEKQLQVITRVDVALTAPAYGATPDDTVTVQTQGVHLSDRVEVRWYYLKDNSAQPAYPDEKVVNEEPFRGDMTYLLPWEMEADEGYAFAEDVQVYCNGVLMPAPGSSITTSALLDEDALRCLFVQEVAVPVEEVARVDVSLVEPVVGAMPQNSITIHTDGVVDGGMLPVQWMCIKGDEAVAQYDDGTLVRETPFRAGTTYILAITMDTEDGYAFTDDVQVYWNEQLAPALGSEPATSAGYMPIYQQLAFAYVGQAKVVYAITFDPNGGAVTPQQDTTGADGKLAALPTPTHSDRDLEFQGWFTAKEGGTQVNTDTVFTQDTILYARWGEKTHLTPPTGDGSPAGLYLALLLVAAAALAFVTRAGAKQEN